MLFHCAAFGMHNKMTATMFFQCAALCGVATNDNMKHQSHEQAKESKYRSVL